VSGAASSRPQLRYVPYSEACEVPNVVVDGAANHNAVLCLSHWPGSPVPSGLEADLSAQMAFAYAARGLELHHPATVVTNNHFDQDGLVSLYALTHPADALPRRRFLEDVAAAGDFATYRDRDAARVSMVLAAYADPERSPFAPLPADYDAATALLCAEMLPRLAEMTDRVEAHRELWQDEDAMLSASEDLWSSGAATVTELGEVDLAVATLPERAVGLWGHRFGGERFFGIHPMALHNVTDRFAILCVTGRRYRFVYRYETWVQYRTTRPRARVALEPLAERLNALEPGADVWHADPVSDLTPQLRTVDGAESALDAPRVLAELTDHLRRAPAAWDPYPERDVDGDAETFDPTDPPTRGTDIDGHHPTA
jgi:hypothetical protein